MAAQLESLVQRLEAVTSKLEGVASGRGKSTGSVDDDMPQYVEDFEAFIKTGPFRAFQDSCNYCKEEAQKAGELMKKVFDECLTLLKLAATNNTPDQNTLQKALRPLSDAISATQAYREDNRRSKHFNHLSAISEAVPALGWVAVAPKPALYVKQMEESAMFYTNKVLKEFRESDPQQANFATNLIKLLKALEQYIVDNHGTGLQWNRDKPRLTEATLASAVSAVSGGGSAGGAPAPPPPGGAPPPPPPPAVQPPAAAAPAVGSGANDNRQALFADLNKGTDVTKGLKKVTDDMKTHKNPSLRTGPQPFKASPHSSPKPYTAPKPHAKAHAAPAATTKPAVCKLEGKKWIVENQVGNKNLVIAEVNMKQTVYIYRCQDSAIQIKGKVNSIIVDSCKKTGVVCESVVAGFEFINCQSVQGQALGAIPTLSIDKTDGCQVYLAEEHAKNAEIVTAKSSEMNICITKKDGDLKEYALPEQYKTKFDGKKMTTTTSESLG